SPVFMRLVAARLKPCPTQTIYETSTSSSARCGTLCRPAIGARGQSPPGPRRGSARARSRSAVLEYCPPRDGFSAVAELEATAAARAGARQIFRENARTVARYLPAGRATAGSQWGSRKDGSKDLREIFPRGRGKAG